MKKSKKETIDIYVHFEKLDRKPSGVVTSVLLVPFSTEKSITPYTDDGEIKEVINIDSFFQMFKPYYGCIKQDMFEVLDIKCVFEESMPVYTQLLDGKTIDAEYVKKRFSCSDYERVDNAINTLDLTSNHRDIVSSHIACYIRTLQEKYNVRLWVKEYEVDGVILKEILDAHSEDYQEESAIDKDNVMILSVVPIGSFIHDCTVLISLNEPDPYKKVCDMITGIYNNSLIDYLVNGKEIPKQ